MLIYIVGDPGQDNEIISDVVDKCVQKGHAVAVSTLLMVGEKDIVTQRKIRDLETYLVARCDAVVAVSDDSYGVHGEDALGLLEYAKTLGLSIYGDHYEKAIPDLHPTEVRCPEQVQAFAEFIGKMHRTHLSKNADYSPANILGTGKVGVTTRLWDKMARVMSLLGYRIEVNLQYEPRDAELTYHKVWNNSNQIGLMSVVFNMWDSMMKVLENAGFVLDVKFIDYSGEKAAQHEKIEDTFRDNAVYSGIALLIREDKWGK